mgnify:CR=1 FL=1
MVVIKRLGKGGYGTVHLVSTPETKSIHLALKMISKYNIVKNHQEKYILRERVRKKLKRLLPFLKGHSEHIALQIHFQAVHNLQGSSFRLLPDRCLSWRLVI